MALLPMRQLLRLPVFTQSGVRLGRVAGCQIEVESQTILRYEVRRSLFGVPFLVSREQVISIDADRMVVEDALARARERVNLAMGKPATEESQAALSSGRE